MCIRDSKNLEADSENATARATALESSLSDERARADTAESAASAATAKIDALQKELSAAHEVIKNLEADIESDKARQAELEANVADERTRADSSNACEELKAALDASTAKLAKSIEDSTLADAIHAAKIAELEDTISYLKDELQCGTDTIASLERTILELQDEIDSTQRRADLAASLALCEGEEALQRHTIVEASLYEFSESLLDSALGMTSTISTLEENVQTIRRVELKRKPRPEPTTEAKEPEFDRRFNNIAWLVATRGGLVLSLGEFNHMLYDDDICTLKKARVRLLEVLRDFLSPIEKMHLGLPHDIACIEPVSREAKQKELLRILVHSSMSHSRAEPRDPNLSTITIDKEGVHSPTKGEYFVSPDNTYGGASSPRGGIGSPKGALARALGGGLPDLGGSFRSNRSASVDTQGSPIGSPRVPGTFRAPQPPMTVPEDARPPKYVCPDPYAAPHPSSRNLTSELTD
eukprot:TRINITY_DN7023_c0_g1_i8.p1 TRINITY_DN7023_c0_g1~~TRINITY_DN7023_c0_g1_i8.p1  ORF type:complete len:469 (+),score=88.50 TRINITY_DN7023_c0_g1_i8:198-1604(+)